MAELRSFPARQGPRPKLVAVPTPLSTAHPRAAERPTSEPVTATDPLTPTIFHERWWLDAVSGGDIQTAELRSNGRLVAWMPYRISRRRGFSVSVMPDLTHLLGPAIDEGRGSSNNRWLHRLEAVRELVGQLPSLGLFSQTCHPETSDVLGFQAQGFDSFVQFSAEVEPAAEDLTWRRMRDKTRNVIRRAQERGRVEPLHDPEEFRRFYAANLARFEERSYFDLDRIGPLFEAARGRDQARIIGVRNHRHELVAAVFYVWDRRRLWYLLSTRDAGVPDNGAVSLLIWHGLQEAGRRGLTFDFDGIASEGATRFFAGFGAEIRPRYAVYRMSPSFAAARSFAACVRGGWKRNHFTAP
jgi:hypothetical protein